jgi:hypothetical protein
MAGSTPSCQPRASVAGNTFPSIGRIARNISAGLAIGLPLAAAWIQPAQAVLIYNFYELGGNLVVDGTGSLSLPSPFATGGSFVPSNGLLRLDLASFLTGTIAPTIQVDGYSITGPTTLGAGIIPTINGGIASSSDSGIGSALIYNAGVFVIDSTYVSGTTINSSSTFTGISLASLGMPNSGILGTWTLVDPNNSSYVGDTISVQVNAGGSLANVPGPLPILGVAAAFGFSRKLRKRIKLHKGTSDISTSASA